MNKQEIRIRTKTGKMIERRAEITNWIDNNGNRSSTAQVGNVLYEVVDRDYYGPIYAVPGSRTDAKKYMVELVEGE